MRHILIYGASIVLVSLADRLFNLQDTRIVCRSSLSDLGDLVIFGMVIIDINDSFANDLLALLRVRPGLPVVAINSSAGTVTILSGQVFLVRSIEDILTCLPRLG